MKTTSAEGRKKETPEERDERFKREEAELAELLDSQHASGDAADLLIDFLARKHEFERTNNAVMTTEEFEEYERLAQVGASHVAEDEAQHDEYEVGEVITVVIDGKEVDGTIVGVEGGNMVVRVPGHPDIEIPLGEQVATEKTSPRTAPPPSAIEEVGHVVGDARVTEPEASAHSNQESKEEHIARLGMIREQLGVVLNSIRALKGKDDNESRGERNRAYAERDALLRELRLRSHDLLGDELIFGAIKLPDVHAIDAYNKAIPRNVEVQERKRLEKEKFSKDELDAYHSARRRRHAFFGALENVGLDRETASFIYREYGNQAHRFAKLAEASREGDGKALRGRDAEQLLWWHNDLQDPTLDGIRAKMNEVLVRYNEVPKEEPRQSRERTSQPVAQVPASPVVVPPTTTPFSGSGVYVATEGGVVNADTGEKVEIDTSLISGAVASSALHAQERAVGTKVFTSVAGVNTFDRSHPTQSPEVPIDPSLIEPWVPNNKKEREVLRRFTKGGLRNPSPSDQYEMIDGKLHAVRSDGSKVLLDEHLRPVKRQVVSLEDGNVAERFEKMMGNRTSGDGSPAEATPVIPTPERKEEFPLTVFTEDGAELVVHENMGFIRPTAQEQEMLDNIPTDVNARVYVLQSDVDKAFYYYGLSGTKELFAIRMSKTPSVGDIVCDAKVLRGVVKSVSTPEDKLRVEEERRAEALRMRREAPQKKKKDDDLKPADRAVDDPREDWRRAENESRPLTEEEASDRTRHIAHMERIFEARSVRAHNAFAERETITLKELKDVLGTSNKKTEAVVAKLIAEGKIVEEAPRVYKRIAELVPVPEVDMPPETEGADDDMLTFAEEADAPDGWEKEWLTAQEEMEEHNASTKPGAPPVPPATPPAPPQPPSPPTPPASPTPPAPPTTPPPPPTRPPAPPPALYYTPTPPAPAVASRAPSVPKKPMSAYDQAMEEQWNDFAQKNAGSEVMRGVEVMSLAPIEKKKDDGMTLAEAGPLWALYMAGEYDPASGEVPPLPTDAEVAAGLAGVVRDAGAETPTPESLSGVALPGKPVAEEVARLFERRFEVKQEELEMMSVFSNLSPGQQLLVLRHLESQTLSDVETAERAHKAKMTDKHQTPWWKRAWYSVTLGKTSKDLAKETLKTARGRAGIGKTIMYIERLAKAVAQGPDAVVEDGKMQIAYLSKKDIPLPPDTQLSEKELGEIKEFNNAATRYAELPHDWKYQSSEKTMEGGERKRLEACEREYRFAREKMTIFLRNKYEAVGKSMPTERAMLAVNGIDEQVALNQIFTTHPDAERALADIDEKSAWRQAGKAFWKSKGAFLLVYGTGARGAAALGAGLLGAPALPAALAMAGLGGFASGLFIGRKEAHNTLKDKRVSGRMSEQDEREEIEYTTYKWKKDAQGQPEIERDAKGNPIVQEKGKRKIREFTDATFFVDRIERLIAKLDTVTEPKERALIETKIAQTNMLMAEKFRRGMINFGGNALDDTDNRKGDVVANKLSFIQALHAGAVTTLVDPGKLESYARALTKRQDLIEGVRGRTVLTAMLKAANSRAWFGMAGASLAHMISGAFFGNTSGGSAGPRPPMSVEEYHATVGRPPAEFGSGGTTVPDGALGTGETFDTSPRDLRNWDDTATESPRMRYEPNAGLNYDLPPPPPSATVSIVSPDSPVRLGPTGGVGVATSPRLGLPTDSGSEVVTSTAPAQPAPPTEPQSTFIRRNGPPNLPHYQGGAEPAEATPAPRPVPRVTARPEVVPAPSVNDVLREVAGYRQGIGRDLGAHELIAVRNIFRYEHSVRLDTTELATVGALKRSLLEAMKGGQLSQADIHAIITKHGLGGKISIGYSGAK